MALLEVKNLKKSFVVHKQFGASQMRVQAVDGMDLSIQPGEHTGLVGESGSGKSTLARLIVKLYQPDSGQIFLDGKEISGLSAAAFRPYRPTVQMVFQNPYSSLDPRFTVQRILKEAVDLLPQKLRAHDPHDMMCKILMRVGLTRDALSRFPHEFSGGERQRIAIARALIMRPKLLILDEAVSALDVLIQSQIMDLLHSIQEEFGVTYLFITHNLRIVRRLCQRIAVMYQGKVVESAGTEDLFKNPLHPYTQQLLTAALDYQALETDAEKFSGKNFHLIDKGHGHFVLD